MLSRESVFGFIKNYGNPIVLTLTLLVIFWHAYHFDYTVNPNIIIGKFVSVVINGLSASSSLVAFGAVYATKEDQWGELKGLQTYFAIGTLIGFIASTVWLFNAS